MRRLRARGTLFAVLLIALAACRPAGGAAPRDVPPTLDGSNRGAPIEGHAQASQGALAEDLELVAKERGWTAAKAEAYREATEAVGWVAEQLAEQRPDQFVGSALAEDPSHPPTLYIKGSTNDFIMGLVASTGVEIIVADGQPYSFDELEARSHRVHRALVAIGFESVSTGFDITRGGVITSAVSLQDGLPSSIEEILDRLPADLRASVDLTIHDEPTVDPEG